MSKKKLYRFCSRIHKTLKTGELKVFLKRLKDAQGLANFKKGTIELDPRYEVVSTLIHECLHHFHPDWSEKKVLAEESKIIHQLSHIQIRNLIRTLGEVL